MSDQQKIYCGNAKNIAAIQGGLKVNICLSDIPKEFMRKGNNGKMYVNLDVLPLRQQDAYGNSHSVKVDTWKPNQQQHSPPPQQQTAPTAQSTESVDELPF